MMSIHNNATRHSVNHQNLSKSAHRTKELVVKVQNRRKFVDEYLYDRLFMAQKPFTVSILRSLRKTMDNGSSIIKSHQSHGHLHSSIHSGSVHSLSVHSRHKRHKRRASTDGGHDEPLPYGVHHIDPSILAAAQSIESSVFADFVLANKELLKPNVLKEGISTSKLKSSDPAVRSAFSSKLDTQTKQIQDLQVIVQQFYECRIASLERYLAFCVMFHAMAKDCKKPWFMPAWDIARSQSNLRVATTCKCFIVCCIDSSV
ncbi:hypothetical protein EON65_01555 [archaeon]|nr:MAG: hypothetical protein EON65_01555 [archaeon]